MIETCLTGILAATRAAHQNISTFVLTIKSLLVIRFIGLRSSPRPNLYDVELIVIKLIYCIQGYGVRGVKGNDRFEGNDPWRTGDTIFIFQDRDLKELVVPRVMEKRTEGNEQRIAMEAWL